MNKFVCDHPIVTFLIVDTICSTVRACVTTIVTKGKSTVLPMADQAAVVAINSLKNKNEAVKE